jgi:formate hydrogenlyase subunit 4
MPVHSFINILLILLLAPLLLGVINKTKAFFAGRKGQPLLQPYYDLWKLLHKGAVYSSTTGWVFRTGPLVGLSAVVMALMLVPVGGGQALLAFSGDLVLFVYLLALMRFFTVIAALDTGSSFEGMGAGREVQFSALAEPAFILCLAALAHMSGSLSLSVMFSSVSAGLWLYHAPALILLVISLMIVFLAENARIPVDDPNTHLELTMIHEVMVLDHCGPDFAFILYGAALKLWVMGSLLVAILVPVHSGNPWLDISAYVAGMIGLAMSVGVIESIMARLRLNNVPHLLVGAGVLAVLALMLALR